MKVFKCRYCKNNILENELFLGNISRNPNKIINGKFHKKCYEKYLEKREEENKFKMNDEDKQYWNDLYNYVRYEILEYKQGMQLSSYARNKLQGLRVGDFTVKHGQKIIDSKGYSYQIILKTFQIMKLKILTSIRSKTFNNENHKFNYIMYIVKDNINDVLKKYEQRQRSINKFENLNINDNKYKIKYKKENNLKNNKVANLLEDLL